MTHSSPGCFKDGRRSCGFIPADDDVFGLLDWTGTLSGTFSAVRLPLGPASWDISQLYQTGEVRFLAGKSPDQVSIRLLGGVNGLPEFEITSLTARRAVIEASTDLVNWIEIQSVTIGSTPVRFSDPANANFPGRFYRVSWHP